jgi:hypothetical protein
MLDVHPPEHAAHSWRDFFIHIATIVFGLLIAIGLEQTVEWMHHHHQREQLERDLVVEAKNNLELMKLDDRYFEEKGQVLAASRSEAENLRTQRTSGPRTANVLSLTTSSYYYPDAPVWNTAKEGGVVGLLPRREAAMYDLVYAQQSLMTAEFHEYRAKQAALSDFSLRFTSPSSQDPDLARMSPEDLREFSVLLANLQGEMARFKHMTVYAEDVTRQAAQGNTDDQQGFEKIGVSKRH